MKGWGRVGAAGVLAAVALLSGCREKAAPPAPEPPVVKVVPATQGYMFESSVEIASVKSFEEVNLVARVEGFLVKRLFEEGQAVKKGQLLYEIEPEVYAAKVKAAEAELAKVFSSLHPQLGGTCITPHHCKVIILFEVRKEHETIIDFIFALFVPWYAH